MEGFECPIQKVYPDQSIKKETKQSVLQEKGLMDKIYIQYSLLPIFEVEAARHLGSCSLQLQRGLTKRMVQNCFTKLYGVTLMKKNVVLI